MITIGFLRNLQILQGFPTTYTIFPFEEYRVSLWFLQPSSIDIAGKTYGNPVNPLWTFIVYGRGAITVDSGGVEGARVPPEFGSSEKSTLEFVKLSTALGGTCNLKTGVNLVSLYFLCDKQRVESELEGVLLHPFL